MIIFQRIYIKGQQVHERILNITVIKEMQIKASMITSGLIWEYACMHAKLLQSCLTLCDPMNCSPPASSVHGILQAGILEWVAIPSSRGSSPPRDQAWVSRIAGKLLYLIKLPCKKYKIKLSFKHLQKLWKQGLIITKS